MLDVRNAEATVEKDRDYILALAERTLGINTFNSKLRQVRPGPLSRRIRIAPAVKPRVARRRSALLPGRRGAQRGWEG
jgi:hypothetical protein